MGPLLKIFDFATKVTTGYALYAYAIAGVVSLVRIVSLRKGNSVRPVPLAAWTILGLAICMPTVGEILKLVPSLLRGGNDVSGQVFDAQTKEPLPDVDVYLSGTTAKSGNNGYYSLQVPPRDQSLGSFSVTAMHAGSKSITKTVTTNEPKQDFLLPPIEKNIPSPLSKNAGPIVKEGKEQPDESTGTVAAPAADGGNTAELDGEGYWVGANVDYPKAMGLFKTAAGEGNAKANAQIGWMYENGLGAPADCVQAKSWYEKAYSSGYVNASWNIGRLYDLGCGVGQDKKTAVVWYEIAAKNGLSEAFRDLKKLGVTPP
jgi:hypothetical protein